MTKNSARIEPFQDKNSWDDPAEIVRRIYEDRSENSRPAPQPVLASAPVAIPTQNTQAGADYVPYMTQKDMQSFFKLPDLERTQEEVDVQRQSHRDPRRWRKDLIKSALCVGVIQANTKIMNIAGHWNAHGSKANIEKLPGSITTWVFLILIIASVFVYASAGIGSLKYLWSAAFGCDKSLYKKRQREVYKNRLNRLTEIQLRDLLSMVYTEEFRKESKVKNSAEIIPLIKQELGTR